MKRENPLVPWAVLYARWPVSCQLLDVQGRVRDVNGTWLAELGYRREEVVDRLFGDFLTPSSRVGFERQFPGFLAQGVIADCELELHSSDGSTLTMDLSGVFFQEPQGDSPLAHCLLHNVTHWRRTEAALRASEAAFRGLFDTGPTAVSVVRGRTICQANALMSQITGYSENELLGQSPRIQYPDEAEYERVGRELYGAMKRDGFGMVEARHQRKNGEIYDVLLCARPMETASPDPAIMVTLLDITDRKRAEAALRESERKYREVFHASSDAIFVHEMPGGRLVDVNDAMLQLYGFASKAEAMACAVGDLSLNEPPYTAAEAAERLRRAFEEGPQVFDWRARRKNGELFWAEVTLRRSEIGGHARLLASVRDVTERRRVEAALRSSQKLLNDTQRIVHIGSWELDLATHRFVWSDECYRIYGVDPQIFQPSLESFSAQALPEDRPMIAGHYQETLASRFFRTFECRIRRGDGVVRWLHITGEMACDAAGVPLKLLGTQQDITDQRQAEQALRDSERHWQQTFDAIGDGVALISAAGLVFKCNSAMEKLAGHPASEMVGRPCCEVFHHGADPVGDCPLVRICKSGRRDVTELPLGERQFQITVDPMFNDVGELTGVVHIMSDITERKQAEIRISEQAALLAAANDAIYVRALDHTITYWNDGAERLFEVPRDRALGCKITDHYYSGVEAFEAAHAALLKQGSWSGELKRKNQTGREVVMFCRWTLLHDAQGRPKEVLAITTDITEQKRLEAGFLRAQRMEGIGALAGGIAHDLNNILQPILMTVPMLIGAATDTEQREMLETVESCARRGADIIRQLLTFARGTPGERIPLRLRHLLGEMDKIIRETFPRNIRVAVEVPPDLWLVMGDLTQIHQALMNLCVNARDAMPEGGRITLAATNQQLDESFAGMASGARPGPHVCVSVTDTGAGIPPEVQERIFDPFFTTKEIGKGTGLGLATVLGIMRGHGGFVRMSSQVGKGTRFELYFPASLETQTEVAASEPTLPPRAAGELILVVDDEPSVRKVIQRILERHGYQVVTASEGGEALAIFARHQKEIRAVITDMMMPGMDGPTVVRSLRQQEPQLPIIGMTGIGKKADIKGLCEEDLTLLLAKPFGGANLIETLHRILPASNSRGGIS